MEEESVIISSDAFKKMGREKEERILFWLFTFEPKICMRVRDLANLLDLTPIQVVSGLCFLRKEKYIKMSYRSSIIKDKVVFEAGERLAGKNITFMK